MPSRMQREPPEDFSNSKRKMLDLRQRELKQPASQPRRKPRGLNRSALTPKELLQRRRPPESSVKDLHSRHWRPAKRQHDCKLRKCRLRFSRKHSRKPMPLPLNCNNRSLIRQLKKPDLRVIESRLNGKLLKRSGDNRSL